MDWEVGKKNDDENHEQGKCESREENLKMDKVEVDNVVIDEGASPNEI